MTWTFLHTLTALSFVCFAATSMAATTAEQTDNRGHKDIVDTAVAAEDFTTLVKAVKAAELVDVLKGKEQFTVFAPTNKAFEKVSKDELQALLRDKQKLQSILTYHVVPGKVMAADVVKLQSAKTVQGHPVEFTIDQGKVMINAAKIVKTDIECSNGVIHVIDTVLLPPME